MTRNLELYIIFIFLSGIEMGILSVMAVKLFLQKSEAKIELFTWIAAIEQQLMEYYRYINFFDEL